MLQGVVITKISQQSQSFQPAMNVDDQQQPSSEPDAKLLDDTPKPDENRNIPLLVAVSTAIWKLAASPEARDRFRQLGAVHFFIRQLYQTTEEVILNYYDYHVVYYYILCNIGVAPDRELYISDWYRS